MCIFGPNTLTNLYIYLQNTISHNAMLCMQTQSQAPVSEGKNTDITVSEILLKHEEMFLCHKPKEHFFLSLISPSRVF